MNIMLHKTKIGVCMDYAVAYLLEEKNHEKVITIIEADEEPKAAPHKRHQEFFKKVYDLIKDFDKVALFGPAAVKRELLSRIKAGKLPIEIQNNPIEDNVTETQKFDFINEYFSTS